MEAFADWLASTAASAAIQKTLWLIPFVQTVHIIFVALVFSSVVMIEFRLFGLSKSGTLEQTVHRFVPWIYAGVVVLALTGVVLIVGEPKRSLPSFEFRMKMLFLVVALALTSMFAQSVRHHARVWASAAGAPVSAGARTTVNALALLALGAWGLVVVYGRLIAYTVPH